ncbi:outer membrane beta-barrel protein [Vibrio ichthyoenteri]|nr:outer membrane beta-barrel protein [Vibrio ichthyoenteri]
MALNRIKKCVVAWWVMAATLPISFASFGQIGLSDFRYGYVDFAAGSLDEKIGENSNVTAINAGGKLPIDRRWLATLDYSARFIHPDKTTTEIYTVLPGVAARIDAGPGLQFLANAKAGMQWARLTDDKTNIKLESSNEFVWGMEVGLVYNITPRWRLATDAELNRSDILDVEIYSLRADFRINSGFTMGGFYSHRDSERGSTNEGGVAMKLFF